MNYFVKRFTGCHSICFTAIKKVIRIFKLKLLVLVFAGVLPVSYLSAHELDSEVKEVMSDWAVPGMAIAVVKNNKVIFSRGYGVREMGREEKVNEHTIFGIGSMTKSFTSAAAAIMVDEGKMNWDDKIIKFLPQFGFRDSWITQKANIRDLATHRVGIDADVPWMNRSWDTDKTLAAIKYLKPVQPYGDFLYSNTGSLTLGKIVEAVSGQAWDDVINSRLFGPLGMKRSNTRETDYVQNKHLALCWVCAAPSAAVLGQAALKKTEKNAAVPHGLSDKGKLMLGADRAMEVWPWRYEPAITPAGAINSTAHDMAKWLLFHLNEGRYKDRQIISREQMQYMHNIHIIRRFPNRQNPTLYDQAHDLFGYGLNWDTSIYRGHRYSGHGGGQVGFGGYMYLVPAEKLGIIVLQNVDYRDAKAFVIIARRFLDYYLGLSELDWNTYAKEKWSPVREGRFAADKIEKDNNELQAETQYRYTGEYYNPAIGEVSVSDNNGALVLKLETQSWARLYHQGNSFFIAEFQGSNRWQTGLAFRFGASEKANSFVLGEEGGTIQKFEFSRVE